MSRGGADRVEGPYRQMTRAAQSGPMDPTDQLAVEAGWPAVWVTALVVFVTVGCGVLAARKGVSGWLLLALVMLGVALAWGADHELFEYPALVATCTVLVMVGASILAVRTGRGGLLSRGGCLLVPVGVLLVAVGFMAYLGSDVTDGGTDPHEEASTTVTMMLGLGLAAGGFLALLVGVLSSWPMEPRSEHVPEGDRELTRELTSDRRAGRWAIAAAAGAFVILAAFAFFPFGLLAATAALAAFDWVRRHGKS